MGWVIFALALASLATALGLPHRKARLARLSAQLDEDDAAGRMPRSFRPSTTGLGFVAGLIELPIRELVATLGRDRALCERVLVQSYDKRYSPSTFVEETGEGFRVGWYHEGYRAVRVHQRLELAIADYLLFSFGKGRLPRDAA